MASNPLVAALKIAFETIHVSKLEICDAVTLKIAEWAGVPYDDAPDASNDTFHETNLVIDHHLIIRDFVTCTRNMILNQGHSAQEILLSTFERRKKSPSFPQLQKKLKRFLQQADKEIEQLEINSIGYDIEALDEIDEANERRCLNQSIIDNLAHLTNEDFLNVYDSAVNADKAVQDIFVYEVITKAEAEWLQEKHLLCSELHEETPHPLIAAVQASFETAFICPTKRGDALPFQFAEWANISYTGEKDIESYHQSEKISRHEMMMIDFVDCIHDMLLTQNIQAKEILMDIFTQKTGSQSLEQLRLCHQNFISTADKEMNEIGPVTKDSHPIDKDRYCSAEDRKKHNQNLLQDIYLPNTDLFYRLYETADMLDNKLQNKEIRPDTP